MLLLTTKDLAQEMVLHPRTVKRWWKALRVPPDACAANGCHRWTRSAAKRLFKRWRDWWIKRGYTPQAAVEKFTGAVKRAAEDRQLKFRFGSAGARPRGYGAKTG